MHDNLKFQYHKNNKSKKLQKLEEFGNKQLNNTCYDFEVYRATITTEAMDTLSNNKNIVNSAILIIQAIFTKDCLGAVNLLLELFKLTLLMNKYHNCKLQQNHIFNKIMALCTKYNIFTQYNFVCFMMITQKYISTNPFNHSRLSNRMILLYQQLKNSSENSHMKILFQMLELGIYQAMNHDPVFNEHRKQVSEMLDMTDLEKMKDNAQLNVELKMPECKITGILKYCTNFHTLGIQNYIECSNNQNIYIDFIVFVKKCYDGKLIIEDIFKINNDIMCTVQTVQTFVTVRSIDYYDQKISSDAKCYDMGNKLTAYGWWMGENVIDSSGFRLHEVSSCSEQQDMIIYKNHNNEKLIKVKKQDCLTFVGNTKYIATYRINDSNTATNDEINNIIQLLNMNIMQDVNCIVTAKYPNTRLQDTDSISLLSLLLQSFIKNQVSIKHCNDLLIIIKKFQIDLEKANVIKTQQLQISTTMLSLQEESLKLGMNNVLNTNVSFAITEYSLSHVNTYSQSVVYSQVIQQIQNDIKQIVSKQECIQTAINEVYTTSTIMSKSQDQSIVQYSSQIIENLKSYTFMQADLNYN